MAVWRFETIAAAIPEETYGWRPGEGVRSVSEAVMHVAHGNFLFADWLGLPRPEELPEDLETITDKGRVLLVLRQSVEHIEAAMEPAFAAIWMSHCPTPQISCRSPAPHLATSS